MHTISTIIGVFHVGFQGVLPTPSVKAGGQATPTRMHVISVITNVIDGGFDAWFGKLPPTQPTTTGWGVRPYAHPSIINFP